VIGIDIVKVSRIGDFLNKLGEKGLNRFLSKNEIDLAGGKVETLAGFWATKEAFSKSIGTGIGKDLSFHDMEIWKNDRGQPHLKLSNEKMKHFKIEKIAISITHDGDFAISVATWK
jgi:holo-[acyl-carrier protein] synthase